MTNQEAIKILYNLKPGDYSNPYEKGEAIVMAIKALQAQETKHSNESSLTQKALDIISRQAAIDAMGKLYDADLEAYGCEIPEMFHSDRAIEALNALPPAQPEPSIPISWIEKQIDWLKSMDNEFSNITAMNISVLVKKWRKENGKDERSN